MGEQTLGEVLRAARTRTGMTLRDVEKRTDIHNAHLSQVETGKITRPEMALLWTLADLYELSYPELLRLSGHANRATQPESQQVGVALRAMDEMDTEQRQQVIDFIEQLRSRRRE